MIKRIICCGLALSAALSVDAQMSLTEPVQIILPLATQSSDAEGCYSADELTDPGAKAYIDHIGSRFANPIVLCLTENSEGSAAFAQRGDASLAWIDQGQAADLGDEWRTFLTLRAKDGLGRPPYVLFTVSDASDIGSISISEIGFVGQEPERLFVGMALETLEDHGFQLSSDASGQLHSDVQELLAAVRTKDSAAGMLDSNAWGRECGILDPSFNPCDDLSVVYQERPRATSAMIISASAPSELRYRMVSIHIALHMEAPEAFDWINQDQGSEFQPAEPDALMPRRAIWTGSE